MISIESIHGTLVRRVSRIDQYLTAIPPRPRFQASLHKSAAVSYLWQAWVIHNREMLTACLSGRLVVAGTSLATNYNGMAEDELLYLAQQYAEGNQPKPGGRIKSHLSEPNWGDISKAVGICSGASFECSNYFSNCFSLGVRLRDLQLCRNTCAHISKGQLADFNKSRVRYNNNTYLHPSDMINWIDPGTQQPVWNSWTGEMLTISELLVGCK